MHMMNRRFVKQHYSSDLITEFLGDHDHVKAEFRNK